MDVFQRTRLSRMWRVIFILLSSLFLVVGGACSRSAPLTEVPSNYPDGFFANETDRQTAQAALTQVALSIGTTPKPIIILPTNTPEPGAVNSTIPPDEICNRADFIADVTIEDGTEFSPQEPFTKIWRLKNTSTCTWTSSYEAVFQSGDAMAGPPALPVTNGVITPGQEFEISITFQAPLSPGEYHGNWKLRSPSGKIFGLGSSGNSAFWVEIVVTNP